MGSFHSQEKERKMTYINEQEGKGARFPSALIGVGVSPPRYVEGRTLFNNKGDEMVKQK